MAYAERTSVPVTNTRAEIEKLLQRHGAGGFMFGQAAGQAMIMFEMQDRRMKFLVPMPTTASKPRMTENQIAAETRRRWRALLLVLKAKLEAVNSKITTLDEEFLAHIIVRGNETVGDRVIPDLHAAIANGGTLPPLLGPGGGQ